MVTQVLQLGDLPSEQTFSLVRLDDGTITPLSEGTTLLGSGPNCDVRIFDQTASRKHCDITRAGHTLKVRDLGSTNGTHVDGVRVDSAALGAGAKLRVGRVTFSIEVTYAPLPAAQTAKQAFRGLVGKSPAMQRVFNARDRVAHSDVTVLITGETGTGKSALARSIHMAGQRRRHPFIVFDCSAVAPNLIDSALFGHEKGAFTGADRARVGALEAAGEGTLFIDELTELPLDLQPKLLRALEERELKPIGSQETRPVRCRVIAASQHDLRAWAESGRFRQDLYFRLAVVKVPLPALRDRREDIPLIVDQLQAQSTGSLTPWEAMSETLREQLITHPWPGNIRELRNYLERVAVLGEAPDAVDAPAPAATIDANFHDAKAALIADFERRYLARLMERTGRNIKKSAELSGINRRHLYDLLEKYGMLPART